MKQRFAKFIALALAVIMIVTAFPVSAYTGAQNPADGNDRRAAKDFLDWIAKPIADQFRPNYPAQTMENNVLGGTSVHVDAPRGALPADTELDVVTIADLDAVQDAFNAASDERGHVFTAVDINFINNGEEVDPRKPVTVILDNSVIANLENIRLVHFKGGADEIDTAEMETVEQFYVSGQTITFDAEDFSVYAVVGDANDENARLKVQFFHHDTDTEPVAEVLVTKRDKDVLGAIIPDPNVPDTTENELFCGWSVGSNYTAADVDGQHTIDYIRDQVKNYLNSNVIQEGDEFKVYAMVFHYFNVAYVDENGETTLSTDVYYSKDASIDLTVQMSYAPYLVGYRFMGWQKDDGDSTIYQNGETAEFTRPITKLRAQVQKGYWISFEENPGEHYSGATYVPPVFCPNGVIPANAQPTDPTLAGYHLGDASGNKWFKTFNKGTTAADDTWSDPFTFSGTLTQDTTVNAKWTLNDTVDYTIIVWKQNIDDDKNAADSAKTYDYVFSVTESIAPNTPISALDLSEYNALDGSSKTVDGVKYSFYGFKYNTTKGAVTDDTVVVPKGTTVVNLYYDRELVTYYFYIPSGSYTAISGTPDFSTEIAVYYRSGSNYYKITSYNSTNAYYSRTASQINSTSSGNYTVLIDKTHYSLSYSNYYGEWYFTYNGSTYYINDYPNLDYYASVSISGNTFYKPRYTLRETFTGLYDQPLSTYSYTWKTDYRWYMKKGSFISIADNFTRWSSSVDWTSTFYGSVETFTANVYHFLMGTDGTYSSTANFTVPCQTTNGMLFRSFTGFENDEFRVKLPSGVSTYRLIKSVTDNGEDANPRYTYEYDGSTKTATDYHDGAYWTEWIPENRTVTYGDFEPDDMDHLEPLGGKIEFRYYRIKNTVNFLYGTFVTGRDVVMSAPATGQIHQSDPIYYQASIESEAGYDPVTAGDFTDESFVFEGWYTDPGCTTRYSFTGKKMPTGGVTVYAKFRQREFRVFLHVQDDELTWDDIDWNDPDQAWNFRIAYDGIISEGNAIEGVVRNDNNEITNVLIGWYTDEACTHPYNFGTRYTDALGSLAQTYGAAEKADPQYATEDDGTNKDVNRPWINKMVHIYSKWRKVLPGSTGLTIYYNGVENDNEMGKFTLEGSGTSYDYTDPMRYTDGSSFLAHAATTPDANTYQFLYWEILDTNGNVVDTVYPGMVHTINADWAVVTDAPSTNVQPKAPAASAPVKAATDQYQQVSQLVVGHSYLIGYVSGDTVYLLGNTYPSGYSNRPVSVSATVSNGIITGDYGAYTWTVGNELSSMTLQNATAGYLGQSNGYLNFGTTNNTWTYDASTGYLRSTNTSLTYQYVGRSSSGYFDVYSSGYSLAFYEFVEAGEPVTYTKVETPVAGISYVIAQDGVNYALSGTNHPNTTDSEYGKSWLNGVQIERSGNDLTVYENQVPDVTWTAGGSQTSGWTLQNVGNNKYLNYTRQQGSSTVYGYLTVLTSSLAWTYDTSTKYLHNDTIPDGYYYLVFQATNSSGDSVNDYTVSKSGSAISFYARTHTLTVNYVMSDGSTAPAAHVETIAEGVAYSVTSPTIQSYTPDQAVVSGNMSTGDVTVTVTYTPDAHTVTFNWHGGSSTQTVNDGEYATAPADPDSYVENGVTYNFVAWDPNPANTPITSDQVFTAQYKREGFFIVTFKDWNGTVLKTQEVERGQDASAPANPTREGFDFAGWDKEFTNVQSDLVVYATYRTHVSKIYTVTLRAVYGPKQPHKTTHITWHANNTSGEFKHSDEVVINENIDIEFPEGTDGAKVSWTAGGDLVWEDHVFLGWARLDIGDPDTNTIDSQYKPTITVDGEEVPNPDYVKEWPLNEDDLFLKYVPAEGNEEAYFMAKFGDVWKKADAVAADELDPYHGMFAVWANVFYVYHSGTNQVEKIVYTNNKFVDPDTNQFTATYNLAKTTTSGYLYAGYYKYYDGVSSKFNQNDGAKVMTWNDVKVSWNANGELVKDASWTQNQHDEQPAGGTAAKAYNGYNVKWAAVPYRQADNADYGTELNPVAGTTYYIKEVPADKYLRPYLHYTYYLASGSISTAWLISDVDLSYTDYLETGYVVKSANDAAEHIVRSLTVTTTNGDSSQTLTATSLFRTRGYLNYLTVINHGSNGQPTASLLNNGDTVAQYWVTPDGLMVTGYAIRTYRGLDNSGTVGIASQSDSVANYSVTKWN